MKLHTLEQHWNALGEEDPLWAILSAPDKRGGVWDLEEFLDTGPVQVNALLADLRARGIGVGHERALDFGCGVGRLTQALADHFELSDGVDLAPSMIQQAIRINRRGDRCRFHHNSSPDLRLFADETFDLALSLLVFQHMEPELMRGYVAELVRVLRPGGVAYFNVPDHLVLGTDLPRDAARAAIECQWAVRALAPGEVVRLPVTVNNRSPVLWPATARLQVGNHWLSAEGAVLANDDGRAAVEADVAPGGQAGVELAVSAPETPGSYLLEIDLLQEHKGWFATLGSPTLRLGVEVASRASAGGPSTPPVRTADSVFVPRIEMHVMSRDDMLAAIEEAGGVALEVFAVDRCGPSAPSYDYVVGRAVQSGTPHRPSEARPPRAAPPRRPAQVALWDAIARLDDRADLSSFALSSRRRWLGVPSVAARRLLRRALREVLYRQTEFNRSAAALLQEQERQLAKLRGEVGVRDDMLAAANRRIDLLERVTSRDRGESQPPAV
jgi:SAM-dependent methyltransferase